jgi:NADPH:quinone reductase-like Zn-dependent oxidoreductase
MRAAFYEAQGAAADVMQVGNLPDPQPGPGEVRVKVSVAGLCPGDMKFRTGFAGEPLAFPRIVPHQDGAGIIDRVGEGVDPNRVGQRVWVYMAQSGQPFGAAAEYLTLPAERAVPLPDSVSFETRATLGVNAITAHRCLFADGDIRGLRLLIQGGAGGVGLAAILLAKWAGAWVAATVSRKAQADVVAKAGADLIIYRYEDDIVERISGATDGEGVDRIIDVDLATNSETDVNCLAANGVVVAYATENPSAELRLPFLRSMFQSHVFRFVFYYSIPKAAFEQAIRDVTTCAEIGAYRPEIAKIFPLKEIIAAHEAVETGDALGKVLVSI